MQMFGEHLLPPVQKLVATYIFSPRREGKRCKSIPLGKKYPYRLKECRLRASIFYVFSVHFRCQFLDVRKGCDYSKIMNNSFASFDIWVSINFFPKASFKGFMRVILDYFFILIFLYVMPKSQKIALLSTIIIFSLWSSVSALTSHESGLLCHGYTEIPPDTTFLIVSGGVHKLVYLVPILNGPSGDDGVSSSSGAS